MKVHPPVHMRPGMHTPSDEGTPPCSGCSTGGCQPPSYEGTPPVVDATPSTHASWYAHPQQ